MKFFWIFSLISCPVLMASNSVKYDYNKGQERVNINSNSRKLRSLMKSSTTFSTIKTYYSNEERLISRTTN